VDISPCKGSVHGASATSASPLSTPRSIYFGGSHGDLYAINAQTGNVRWCIHALPVEVGRPAVVDGVVYVCASSDGETGSLYAFNASDGSLRWRTQTDCWIVDIPFGDYALPLVRNGVVYSGLYAVRAQDGQALWKVHLDLAQEGEFILLAVADGVVYGCTEGGVYAINAQDGSIRWRYPSHASLLAGGPLVVSNKLLIVGTQGSVDQPETSALYAINTDTGSLRWYYLMGAYQGATFINQVVYVSSRDQYLYALDSENGKVLWRRHFSYPVYNAALAVNGVLYINIDGAEALNSTTGSEIWYTPLRGRQGDTFLPSVVVDGVDYLASADGGENCTLYALNASDGTAYWESTKLPQISPLTVV